MQIKYTFRYLAGNKKRLAAIIILLLVTIYSLLGFLAVPALGKYYLTRFVTVELEHQLSIGDLRFNPYSLVVEADNIELAGNSGIISSIAHARINADLAQIFSKTLVLSEFRIDNPLLVIIIDKQGGLNLDELVNKLPQDKATDNGNKVIDLFLQSSLINEGVVSVIDQSQEKTVNSTIDNINLDLSGLSTIEHEQGKYTIGIKPTRGSTLELSGNVSLVPLSISGQFTLANLDANSLDNWITSYLPVAEVDGRVNGRGRYQFNATDDAGVEVIISETNLDIAEASLIHPDTDLSLLFDDLSLAAMKYHSNNNVLEIPLLELNAFRVDDGRGEALLEISNASMSEMIMNHAGKSFSLAAINLGKTGAFARDAEPALLALDGVDIGSISFSGTENRLQAEAVTVNAPGITLEQSADGKLQLPSLPAMQNAAGPEVIHEEDKADASVQEAKGLSFSVNGLSINDSRLSYLSNSGRALVEILNISELSVEQGNLDTGDRAITASTLSVNNGKAGFTINANGEIDLVQLLPGETGEPDPADTSHDNSWRVQVDMTNVSDIVVAVDSQLHDVVQQHRIDVHSMQAENISNAENARTEITLDAGINDSGSLTSSGWIMLSNLAAEQSVRLQDLHLLFSDPFLQQHSGLQLQDGVLSLAGLLTYHPEDERIHLAEVNAELVDLQLNHKANKQKLIAAKKIAMDNAEIATAPLKFHAKNISLFSPYANIHIDEQQNLNILEVFRQPDSTGQPESPGNSGPAAGVDLFIERIDVNDGRLDFADHSLTPKFSTYVHNLEGTAAGLSADPDRYTSLQLEGQVGDFGSAKINGELQPFNYRKRSTVTMNFRNIDTKSLTPYTARFAGRKIESGSLSLNLDYKINNSKLDGNNNVILQSLVLGERVESPEAMDLPLDMAIGLLQDDEGRIDINVPITGDLGNPEFQLDAVIQKAVGNLIGSIVTAPFKFIGQLFGASGEDLKQIAFEPGSADIAPPEAGDLETLSRALVKRPSLSIKITGVYNAGLDGPALARRQLLEDLSATMGEAATPLNFSSPELQSTLEQMGKQRFDINTLESLREKHNLNAKVVDGTEAGATDYYRELFSDMITDMEIATDRLQVLGRNRAAVIAERLTTLEASIADRLSISSDILAVDSQGDLVNVTLEAGTIR